MRLLKYVKRSGRLKEIEKIELQSLESKIQDSKILRRCVRAIWNPGLGD